MKLRPLMAGQSSVENLFEKYIIEECTSFDELLKLYNSFRESNRGKSVILSLDDLNQAEYTSTHATLTYDLDNTEGYDLSGVDAVAFEEGGHIGYLSTPSEFFIRKENFIKQAGGVDFSEVGERGLTIEDKEIQLLEKINEFPLQYLDKQLMLCIIPVEKAYEAICGFPNGYFSSDLNPFENYALAKHLQERYGYELFGIGASLLGFIREGRLEDQQARELIADLIEVYNSKDDISEKMKGIITDKNYFFIKYTESLQ